MKSEINENQKYQDLLLTIGNDPSIKVTTIDENKIYFTSNNIKAFQANLKYPDYIKTTVIHALPKEVKEKEEITYTPLQEKIRDEYCGSDTSLI